MLNPELLKLLSSLDPALFSLGANVQPPNAPQLPNPSGNDFMGQMTGNIGTHLQNQDQLAKDRQGMISGAVFGRHLGLGGGDVTPGNPSGNRSDPWAEGGAFATNPTHMAAQAQQQNPPVAPTFDQTWGQMKAAGVAPQVGSVVPDASRDLGAPSNVYPGANGQQMVNLGPTTGSDGQPVPNTIPWSQLYGAKGPGLVPPKQQFTPPPTFARR